MLKEKLKNYSVILASGSPRRKELLKSLDLDFEIRLKNTEEIYPQELEKEEITKFLSELKANAFEGELLANEILITSDTIVWHENKAIGKPKNKTEAIEILESLSGKTHQVITSVTFKTKNSLNTIFDATQVTFKKLTQQEILHYIKKYQPFDKAGAYGIQEWIGYVGVSKIEGSYANVMGLPVHKVYAYLNEQF
jgi:septum formation protein